MTKSKSVFERFLVVVAALALSLTAMAQIQNGQITGTVLDQQGAAIVGATVKVSNPATGTSFTATTTDTGLFVAKELPPGSYKITVEKQGFKTASQASFAVNAGVIHRVDFKLTVGERTEVVEVVGTAPLVNTEDSKLATTIGSSQIQNLPLNGRNVYDLVRLLPGAVDTRGVNYEGAQGSNQNGTVVNGLRQNFTGFLVNGVSNKGLSGGAVNIPVEDTVQEFQQLTLNNSAQYGNSAGSITNLVTKSGTNSYHGSAWWFVRNDVFDANNFFINQIGEEKPPLRFNQFGGTFGGPILKDKLFFFASYQGDRLITSGTPNGVQAEGPEFRAAVQASLPNSVAALLYSEFQPNVQGNLSNTCGVSGDMPCTLDNYLAADLSGSGFTSTADYLNPANFAGDPRGAGFLPARFAELFAAFPGNTPFLYDTVAIFKQQVQGALFNGNEFSARLDYNWNDSNRMFWQFNWLSANDAFGPSNPNNSNGRSTDFSNPSKNKYPNFQFSYVHTFNPRILNEFRAGYLGNLGPDINTAAPGVPQINFDDGELGFGSYNGYPQTFHENIYTYADMVSISHGKHNFKFGADIRRNIENSVFNVARPSYYFFDPLFFAVDAPYEQVAGVDPGIISGNPAQLASNARHWRNWEYGFYFQDDWKISRRLTLNLGIRYDLYARHDELDDLATTFIKGPGSGIIDDISTGAGQLKDANTPAGVAGTPPCDDLVTQVPFAQLATVCGPGGFAASESLGKGDHNNWGPRVGFAWDVFGDGKTSLRGGFGVSYEGTLYNPLSNSRWNLPFYSFNDVTNFLVGDPFSVIYGLPPCPQAGCNPTFDGPPGNVGQGTGAQATGNLVGWDATNPNLAFLTGIVTPEGIRDPYVYNWFFGVQREILPKLVLEVNYVGTAGHKLFRAEDINRIPGALLPEGTCASDTFGRTLCSQLDSVTPTTTGNDANPTGRLNPNYGTLRQWQNSVGSNYNALQVGLRMQQKHGLTFGANYTWSHSIDGGSTWHSGATTANGPAAGEGFTTDQTLPGLDRGNSIFDVRHRFVGNYIWEMPFFKGKGGFAEAVLGGWQFNGIVAIQSGAHWSPYCRLRADQGCDFNLDKGNNDRPDAAAQNIDATHGMWANGFGVGFGPGEFFTTPCAGCVGNLGRNTFVGPGFWSADLSLFKNIKISERVMLQFRSEGFNVFNHTNFQLPGNGATNNRITSSRFGKAAGAFNPRQLQFGLKLSF